MKIFKIRNIVYTFLICSISANNFKEAHDSILDNQAIIENTAWFMDSTYKNNEPDLNDFKNCIIEFQGFQYEKNTNYNFNLILKGKISPFYFFINPLITNYENPELFFGHKYKKYGVSPGILRAFIIYKNEFLFFKMGRSSVRWGESKLSSLIQSNRIPPYENFQFKFEKYNFKYHFFLGQLSSGTLNDTLSNSYHRIKRFISGRRVLWKINKRLTVGFGDQIIYSGQNRGVEMTYLNPFNPYFFAGIENTENEKDSKNFTDNDNSMLFFHSRIRYKVVSLYSELLIDDYQLDETIRDNQLAYTIGIDGKIKYGAGLFWAFEWTKVDRWTYLHKGQNTHYTNAGHPIGYLFGPDLENFQLYIKYKITKDVEFVTNVNSLKKGGNKITSIWQNNKDINSLDEYKHYYISNFSLIKRFDNVELKFGFANNLIKNDFVLLNEEIKNNYNAFVSLTYQFRRNYTLNIDNG